MSLKPWKILGSNYLSPMFRIDQCELSNGKLLEAKVLEFQTWANVLALTPDKRAVLVRQYRHGVRHDLLELPGGIVEDREDPLVGIKRELLEETGYAASNIVEVGMAYPNPAIQTNRLYCFLALDVEQVDVQNLDESEDMEIELVPLDELIEMTKRGEFLHALQVATLFHALAYMNRIH